MLNVRFDFGFIGRLFGVPRKFLSQVGAFCASFSSGHQIIDVQTPAFPDPGKAPVTVGINEEHLRAFIAGAIDLSNYLTTSDVGVSGGVAAYGHLHDHRYSKLDHAHSGYATVGHSHAWGDITGKPDFSGFLTDLDIDASGGVQGYSSSLTALVAQLTSDGKVPLSMLTGSINGHSGTCYVTIDDYGNLDHSGNLAYTLLNNAKDASASALATDKNIGDGLQYSSTKFALKVRPNYGLTLDANGLALTALTANKWMKTDASGLPATTNVTPAVFSGNPTAWRLVVTNATGDLISFGKTGLTNPITVVTDVSWTGTQIVVAKDTINIESGIVTGTTAATGQTIDTVTYNP